MSVALNAANRLSPLCFCKSFSETSALLRNSKQLFCLLPVHTPSPLSVPTTTTKSVVKPSGKYDRESISVYMLFKLCVAFKVLDAIW